MPVPTVPIYHNKYVPVTLQHPPVEVKAKRKAGESAAASLVERRWVPTDLWSSAVKSAAQTNICVKIPQTIVTDPRENCFWNNVL